MKFDRRFLLRSALAIGASLALPRILFAARPDKAFAATDAENVMAELFGETPVASDRVSIKIPDIAENGAVVPVTISTDLEDVEPSVSWSLTIRRPWRHRSRWDQGLCRRFLFA